MRINQNIAAFNAYRNLSATSNMQAKSLEKLSSGFRINRAADDAAGLVISEGLRSQIGGLKQATRNAQDGISVVQTAEGALTEVHSMLQRMRDLAVQSANDGSMSTEAREAAQAEIDQLAAEIDRIGDTTKFGGVSLLDGTFGVESAKVSGFLNSNSLTVGGTNDTFTVDVNGTGAVTVTLDQATYTAADLASEVESKVKSALLGGTSAQAAYADDVSVKAEATGSGYNIEMSVGGLADTETFVLAEDGTDTFLADTNLDGAVTAASGSGGTFQVGANNTAAEQISVAIDAVSGNALGVDALDVVNDAEAAIDAIDTAIGDVSEQRGDLGAIQNRFEHTIANLQVTTENLQASESRIRDTDMAQEMVNFTRSQILQQAGTAMLAQANQIPQSVLSLLR